MKHYVLALLFLGLILGCTQQQATTVVTKKATNGLSINNLTTNFFDLRINEATNVKLVFKNVGDFIARDVKSLLYGYGLLEKTNEKNTTDSILSGKEDIQFWLLTVPLKLSKTESTTYTLGVRTYYFYNFSGFAQVGFVPSTYSGEDLALSAGTSKSPLTVSVNVRNPVRTLPPTLADPELKTAFTLTAVIQNNDLGTVDYYNCSATGPNPCGQGGYLNTLRMTVPSNWSPITDLSIWSSNDNPINEVIYSLNFTELKKKYYDNLCNESVSAKTPNAPSPYSDHNVFCSAINEAISNLRMVREKKQE